MILKRLEAFDSGSYVCIAELSNPSSTQLLNASSETTLIITSPSNPSNIKKTSKTPTKQSKQDINDYLLSDLSIDNIDDLRDLPPDYATIDNLCF